MGGFIFCNGAEGGASLHLSAQSPHIAQTHTSNDRLVAVYNKERFVSKAQRIYTTALNVSLELKHQLR